MRCTQFHPLIRSPSASDRSGGFMILIWHVFHANRPRACFARKGGRLRTGSCGIATRTQTLVMAALTACELCAQSGKPGRTRKSVVWFSARVPLLTTLESIMIHDRLATARIGAIATPPAGISLAEAVLLRMSLRQRDRIRNDFLPKPGLTQGVAGKSRVVSRDIVVSSSPAIRAGFPCMSTLILMVQPKPLGRQNPKYLSHDPGFRGA